MMQSFKDRPLNLKTVDAIKERNKYATKNFRSTSMNLDLLENYIKITIDSAIDLNDHVGLSDGYRLLALIHIQRNMPDMAINALAVAEAIIKKNNLDKGMYLNIYHTYSTYYLELIGDGRSAAEFCKKGIELSRELKNKEMYMRFLGNLGKIHNQYGRYKNAIDCTIQAYNYCQSKGQMKKSIYYANDLGVAHLGLHEIDQAMYYFLSAFDYLDSFDDVVLLVAVTIGLAKTHLIKEDYEIGIKLVEETLYKIKLNDCRNKSELMLILIELYIGLKDYHFANYKLMDMRDNCDSTHSVIEQLKYYELRASVCEALGDYEQAYLAKKTFHDMYVDHDKKSGEAIINEIETTQLNRTIERLNRIAKIGRELTMMVSEKELLNEVYQQLEPLLNIDHIGIGRLEKDAIIYKAFLVDHKMAREMCTKRSEKNSLAVWVVEHDKEIYINDLDHEYGLYVEAVDFKYRGNDKKEIKSIMIMPLRVKDQVVGVLSVQSYKLNAFSTEDLETFKIIASYVAIALVNSEQAETLNIQARIDNLTGLLNRHGFTDDFEMLKHSYGKNLTSVSMIMLDLDYFKDINDAHGHLAGDEVLAAIGTELRANYSEVGELVARLGGEEFALIVVNRSEEEIHMISEGIRIRIEQLRIIHMDAHIRLTTSIGVTYYKGEEMPSLEQIYNNSDKALYVAKQKGRNQVVFNESAS